MLLFSPVRQGNRAVAAGSVFSRELLCKSTKRAAILGIGAQNPSTLLSDFRKRALIYCLYNIMCCYELDQEAIM